MTLNKAQGFFKDLAAIFKNMSDIVEYSDTQKRTEERLNSMNNSLNEINASLGKLSTQLEAIGEKQNKLEQDVIKLKSGVQKELFETLQNLHEKYVSRGQASVAEKLEAKMYFDEIHNIGEDGWSERYYNEIISLPE